MRKKISTHKTRKEVNKKVYSTSNGNQMVLMQKIPEKEIVEEDEKVSPARESAEICPILSGTGCPRQDGTCLKGLTGVLTHTEIKRLQLIPEEEFKDESLKGTSYDLSLGEGHYVYRDKKWELIWIGEKNEMPEGFEIGNRQTLEIGPFGSALIQLKETVDTKKCIDEYNTFVIGRFDLKLKMFIRGIISQQATQVEPNCVGKLFCYIFNQTGEPIELRYEDKIATIEFSYVSCTIRCSKEKYCELKEMFNLEHKKKYLISNKGIPKSYCGEHGINDIRFFQTNSELFLPKEGGITLLHNKIIELEAQVHDYERNNLKEEKLENEKKKARNLTIFALIISFLSLLVAICVAIFPLLNNSSKVDNKNEVKINDIIMNNKTKIIDGK